MTLSDACEGGERRKSPFSLQKLPARCREGRKKPITLQPVSQSHTLLPPPQRSARFINSGLFFTSSLPFPFVTLSHFGGGGGDGGNKPRGYFLRLYTISSQSLSPESCLFVMLRSVWQ